MRTRFVALVVVSLVAIGASQIASAQLPFQKKESKSGGGQADVGAILAQGQDLLAMITLATDLGVSASEDIVSMFPPEKVEQITKLAAKYNQAKRKRGSANLDTEQLETATSIAALTAKLEQEGAWKSYQKEKAPVVRKANSKLGLMLAADGVAATRVPATVESLKTALNQVTKNPMSGMSHAAEIKNQISVLAYVPEAVASQIQSAKTVRSICSSVAEAEKFSLPPDKPADVTNAKTFGSSTPLQDPGTN